MNSTNAMTNANFPLWTWFVLIGVMLGLLLLDLFVLHRKARAIPLQESLWETTGWIAIALGFGEFIWYIAGWDTALKYYTAYIVEKALSIDNAFVWYVIFSSFAVPQKYRYHVLFYGVIGALVFRFLFLFVGSYLLSTFGWLAFVFGAFLIFTGAHLLWSGGGEESDPRNSRVLNLFERLFPTTENYHGDRFTVKEHGKRFATPLLSCLVLIEASDIVFAIDSVPAVLSIAQNVFVAYSAMAFAVLGLRALYFALEELINRFVYLNYGLSVVLVILGVEFALRGFDIHIAIWITLAVVASIILVSILASFMATRGGASEGENP